MSNACIIPLRRIGTMTLGLLLAVSWGCDQNQSKTSPAKQADAPQGKPMKAEDKMGEAQPTGTAQYATAKTDPKPAPDKVAPGNAAIAAEPAKPKDELEDKRAQAEDMIYATIRIRMEEAIASRSKLLKEGRAPSDEEVRKLEGTIMRARQLLVENGEVVADVEPPIVQSGQ